MSLQFRCDNCNSTDTRFRIPSGSHICNRCGNQWGGLVKKPSSTSVWVQIFYWMIIVPVIVGIVATILAGYGSFRYYKWARVHPQPGLIILGSVFTVLVIIGLTGFHWLLEILFILLAVGSWIGLFLYKRQHRSN